MTPLPALLIPLLVCGAALAAPEEPKTPPSSDAAALEAKVTALKTARDPFHHPSYKKAAPPPEHSDVPVIPTAEITARLNVQGRIKRGNEYFIMLNGRLIGRGDVIDVAEAPGKPVRMRVLSVTQDNIQLEPLSN